MKKNRLFAGIATAAFVFAMSASVAIAAPRLFTSSKTTGDLFTTSTSDSSVTLNIDINSSAYQRATEAAKNVVEVMHQFVANLEEYFKSTGNASVVDDIKAITGKSFDINEVSPFVVENYDESKGDIEFTMEFPTEYKAGAKVAVLIGVIDAKGNIEWNVVEGDVQQNGGIKFELKAELIKKAIANTSVCAIASAPGAVAA